MSDKQETVAARDEVATTITIDLSPPRFVEVKVLAESGIFKNGVQYNQGDTAVLVLSGAKGLEANGDVEIIKEVEDPSKAQPTPEELEDE